MMAYDSAISYLQLRAHTNKKKKKKDVDTDPQIKNSGKKGTLLVMVKCTYKSVIQM
jgi:hypothetical protein